MTRHMSFHEAKRAQITVERHEDALEVMGITLTKGRAHLVVRDVNLGHVFHYVPDYLRVEAAPTCEMQGCDRTATRYGGYKGANDWAGRVCMIHAKELSWSEVLS